MRPLWAASLGAPRERSREAASTREWTQATREGASSPLLPAKTEFYRDATVALALDRTFDPNARLTHRQDTRKSGLDMLRAETIAYDDRTTSAVPVILQGDTPSFYTFGSDASLSTNNSELLPSSQRGLYAQYTSVQYDFTRDSGQRVTARANTFTAGSGANGGWGVINAPGSTYEYFANGYLKKVTNVDGEHLFAYDSRGLVASQTITGEGVYNYSYDPVGRLATITFPDGHVRRQTYDTQGRILSRCYDYGGVGDRCYSAVYDAVGNIVRMVDPEGADVFTVDALNRITSHKREVSGFPDVVANYTYNALGAVREPGGDNVVLDDQRPRLDGGGNAPSAIPANFNSQPVTIDVDGKVTSLNGTTLRWSNWGRLVEAQPPIPAPLEQYEHDSSFRRISRLSAGREDLYLFEGANRVGLIHATGGFGAFAVDDTWLFAGIDDPLRMVRHPDVGPAQTVYYETDLSGNVRRLRAPGGADLGGYRYSVFGKTLEDTTTVVQPHRWKARWASDAAGGIYDVRARQWSPQLGAFLSIDEFRFHDPNATLWGWPGQNPIRFADPFGRGGEASAFPAIPGAVGLAASLALFYLSELANDPAVRTALSTAASDTARYSSPQGPAVFALASTALLTPRTGMILATERDEADEPSGVFERSDRERRCSKQARREVTRNQTSVPRAPESGVFPTRPPLHCPTGGSAGGGSTGEDEIAAFQEAFRRCMEQFDPEPLGTPTPPTSSDNRDQ
jgi:RHS repeat-associated protein